jgi:GMP synthase (glutamine-hydrolysing)
MTKDIHQQKILILDFGSQYTQLIARRIRELGIYCELYPFDMTEEQIRKFAPSGIILSGGPESVTQAKTPRAPSVVFQLGCPILGICYGMQTMAVQLGGEVETAKNREFGYAKAKIVSESPLLANIQDHIDADGARVLDVWMSHGDHVKTLPPGFTTIASTDNVTIAGMADTQRQFYGLLFHIEVTHTRQGGRILEHFVKQICGCEGLWTAGNILQESIEQVRQQVGQDEVILGLSGGADSSVLAALLQKAIGKQLTCVFVDTGLLRDDDIKQTVKAFTEQNGIKLTMIDASERFFAALKGVEEPEQKRKVIGKLFIEVFEEAAKQLTNVTWLAQGTIYSDVIESAHTHSGKAHVIKSHHNVGGLPEKMQLKLLEPLRELFKDEVLRLGLEMGLPYDLLYGHPFPGPGLAVRVLGEVQPDYVNTLRQADAIFMQELHAHELYYQVKQAFCVFLPVKSVGVIGDARQYAHVIALRAVETVDFMTARWAHLPYALLEKVSNRIINEVNGISRVVYDISSKPPATIEWE